MCAMCVHLPQPWLLAGLVIVGSTVFSEWRKISVPVEISSKFIFQQKNGVASVIVVD